MISGVPIAKEKEFQVPSLAELRNTHDRNAAWHVLLTVATELNSGFPSQIGCGYVSLRPVPA